MTAQIHEILIYEGERTSMACTPALPADHPRITRVKITEFGKYMHTMIATTACRRRYIGTWKIENGRLYLVKLRGKYRLEGEEPLFAGWYTGTLVIPKGDLLWYAHAGFESAYKEELHIAIKSGMVTGTHLEKRF